MNIRPAKDPTKCPRTRRELLAHLWGVDIFCNVFKEGAYYAVRTYGRVGATHVRRIDALTFEQWGRVAKDVKDGYVNLKS